MIGNDAKKHETLLSALFIILIAGVFFFLLEEFRIIGWQIYSPPAAYQPYCEHLYTGEGVNNTLMTDFCGSDDLTNLGSGNDWYWDRDPYTWSTNDTAYLHDFTSSNGWDLGNIFTIKLDMRIDLWGNPSPASYIIRKSNDFSLDLFDNYLRWYAYDVSGDRDITVDKSFFPEGDRFVLTIVGNSTHWKIYKDCILLGTSDPFTGTITKGADDLTVGAETGGNGGVNITLFRIEVYSIAVNDTSCWDLTNTSYWKNPDVQINPVEDIRGWAGWSDSSVDFIYTVTDDRTIQRVEIYLDGQRVYSNTSGYEGLYTTTLTIGNGVHEWNVVAYDTDGNINASTNDSFSVFNTPEPFIQLYAPCEGCTHPQQATHFIYNISWTQDAPSWCRIYLDGNNKIEFSDIKNATLGAKELIVPYGSNTWGVLCRLSDGTMTWAQNNITFTAWDEPYITGTLINSSTATTTMTQTDGDVIGYYTGTNFPNAYGYELEMDRIVDPDDTDSFYMISIKDWIKESSVPPLEACYNDEFLRERTNNLFTLLDDLYQGPYKDKISHVLLWDEYPSEYLYNNNCDEILITYQSEFIDRYGYAPDCSWLPFWQNASFRHDAAEFVREGASCANSKLYLRIKARYPEWQILHAPAMPKAVYNWMSWGENLRLVDLYNESWDALLMEETYTYKDYIGGGDGFKGYIKNLYFTEYAKGLHPYRNIYTLGQNFESNTESNITSEIIKYDIFSNVLGGGDGIVEWSREYRKDGNCMVYSCSDYGNTTENWQSTLDTFAYVEGKHFDISDAEWVLVTPEDSFGVMGAAFVKDGLSGGTRAYTAQHRAMELGINMDVKGIRQIINDPSVLDPYQYIMCFQCEYARKELHNLLTALSGSKTIIFDSDSFTKYPNGTAADSSLWSTLTGIDTQRSKTTTDTIDFGNGTVLNLSDTYDIYSVDGLGLPGTVFMDKDNKTLLYKNDGNYYIGIPMWAAWWENVETRKALDGIWRYILNDLSIPEDEYYLTQFNASTMFFRSHSDDGQVFGLSWRQDNRTVNLSTHTGNDYTVEYAPAGNIAGTADYGGMTYLTGSIYDIIVWDTNHSGNPPLDNYPSIVPDWPGIFFSSPASFSVFFNCSASDDQLLASVALLTNESGSLAVVHSEPASGTSDTLSYTHPFPGDGVYAWACRATDNASQQATTSARIVSVGFVSPPNPPVLEMPTNGETTADQTPTLSWQNGTDPDQGDTLTHRLVVTNASGSVHDAPHDTESYTFTQNLSNGLYNWHVQAEDTTARTADSATWTFTINYTGPPQPPYFDPEPTGQIAIEDQHFSYDIGATDPNGDEINYFDDHPGFAIDQDGVIDWTPTNDDVGPNPVNISIYDGTFFAWTLITITVNNVNDAPTAPQLTFANQTVANTTVTLTWLPGHDIDATDTLVHTLTLATDEALTALVHRQNHTGTSRAFALSDGTTYYWTVSCTDGFATATAPTGSFTVDTSYVAPYCGDGTCQTDEGCDVCAADCGACPYCGDGRCQDEEDCESCRADCGDCEEPSRRSGGGSGSTDFYVERTAVTETATAGGAGSEEQPEALAEEAPAAGSQTGTAAEATGALGQQMQGAEEGGIEVLYEEPRQIGEETGNDLFILTPSDIVKIVVLALVAGFLTFFVMAKFTTGEALIAKMKRKLIKRPATVYDLRDILLAHRGITLVRAAKLLGDGLPHTKDLMDFLFHEGLVSRQGKYYSPTQALEEMRDERRR